MTTSTTTPTEDKLSKLLNSSALDRLFDEKLDEFYKKPEGICAPSSRVLHERLSSSLID